MVIIEWTRQSFLAIYPSLHHSIPHNPLSVGIFVPFWALLFSLCHCPRPLWPFIWLIFTLLIKTNMQDWCFFSCLVLVRWTGSWSQSFPENVGGLKREKKAEEEKFQGGKKCIFLATLFCFVPFSSSLFLGCYSKSKTMRKHGWQLPYHPLQVSSPFLTYIAFTLSCLL